jgi:hypothetical protein
MVYFQVLSIYKLNDPKVLPDIWMSPLFAKTLQIDLNLTHRTQKAADIRQL